MNTNAMILTDPIFVGLMFMRWLAYRGQKKPPTLAYLTRTRTINDAKITVI